MSKGQENSKPFKQNIYKQLLLIFIMNFITILGLIAAVCTTTSLMPQTIKIIKTKHTKDLSLGMYILMVAGVLLWLIYGIILKNLPLIAANGISMVFSSTILYLKIKYK